MKEVATSLGSEQGTGEAEAVETDFNSNSHIQERQWLRHQPDSQETQEEDRYHNQFSTAEERRRLNSSSSVREIRSSAPEGGAVESPSNTEAEVEQDQTRRDRSLFRWSRPFGFLRPRNCRRRSNNNERVDSEDSSESDSEESVMSMSMPLSEPNYELPSHARIVDVMEKRSQKTYKYGLGLVCVGATLNWLSFVQGQDSLDLLRYMGITCIVTGALCACLGICRWIGRPLPMPCHRVCDHSQLGNQGQMHGRGDVHVIDVPALAYSDEPVYEDIHPSKPPDYEIVVAGEPPPYDEAIKLDPNALLEPQLHYHKSELAQKDGSLPCRCPSSSHSDSTFVEVSSAVAGASSTGFNDTTFEVNTQSTTISLRESITSSVQSQGDAVVVMVDASEPSASSINGASHVKSYGAPPPYTKEYTPSPRRTAPNSVMPTPEHVVASGSSTTHRHSRSSVMEAGSSGVFGAAAASEGPEVESRLMNDAIKISHGFRRSTGGDAENGQGIGELTPVDIMIL